MKPNPAFLVDDADDVAPRAGAWIEAALLPLDWMESMEEACRQFGVAREKLEIEILSGGSSGIFGLVGKKKAQVRAKLREEINLRDMSSVSF